jgi:hypothetical protein
MRGTRRGVLGWFKLAHWLQLIGTVIGVLINGIIPEWAITLPLFLMLGLMTVQTTKKGSEPSASSNL